MIHGVEFNGLSATAKQVTSIIDNYPGRLIGRRVERYLKFDPAFGTKDTNGLVG
ncbi:hypothetical protein [Burkholderia sp. PAMC 26561]|uniref:hypothetical protein n=1 Tax=Burkholderia sp. PAMC 26561 TaxID=1795043 RepID=UPI000B0F27B6|nr:hypothetical protein [Burkholderia sp. PAMC 26561]